MGGTGGKFFPSANSLVNVLGEVSKAKQQEIDSLVNQFLQSVLSAFNDRDVERTSSRLDQIQQALGSALKMDRLLFGGSVAKHTYVDGISDIDALILLDPAEYSKSTPRTMLARFYALLQKKLNYAGISDISVGRLAVTVTYTDFTSIQLLPAIESETSLLISNNRGTGWLRIQPETFQRQLTALNQNMNRMLIPAIKIVKSINAGIREESQLTGYHIENLAVYACSRYNGPKTLKALTQHMIELIPRLVMSPIADITGQSNNVDDYLGPPNSQLRANAAIIYTSILKKLNAAISVDTWKIVVGG